MGVTESPRGRPAPLVQLGRCCYRRDDGALSGLLRRHRTIVRVCVDGRAADRSFDLLVSLYAGFISERCTDHLRVGGTLLVNPSHGDAAMASIDPRYQLTGVVVSRNGDYSIVRSGLGDYLIPKKPQIVTVEGLHESGRGIGYTTSPFAYLFTRIS